MGLRGLESDLGLPGVLSMAPNSEAAGAPADSLGMSYRKRPRGLGLVLRSDSATEGEDDCMIGLGGASRVVARAQVWLRRCWGPGLPTLAGLGDGLVAAPAADG